MQHTKSNESETNENFGILFLLLLLLPLFNQDLKSVKMQSNDGGEQHIHSHLSHLSTTKTSIHRHQGCPSTERTVTLCFRMVNFEYKMKINSLKILSKFNECREILKLAGNRIDFIDNDDKTERKTLLHWK